MFVFDLSANKQQQLRNIESWMEKIHLFLQPDTKILLVGNKCDLEWQMSKEEAERIAECSFIETSAQNGTNVCEAFNSLFTQVMEAKGVNVNENEPAETTNSSCWA